MFDLVAPDSSPINERFSIFVNNLPNKLSGQLEIVVTADGCEIAGSNTRVVDVRSDRERFVLNPRKLGSIQIQVYLYQNDIEIDRQTKSIQIEGKPIPKPDANDRTPTIPIEIQINNAESLPEDYLELRITQDRNNPPTLTFALTSSNLAKIAYSHETIDNISLTSSPEEKMKSIYQKLGDLARVARKAVPDEEPLEPTKTGQADMDGVGQVLWDELIPKALQQEYKKFKSVFKFISIVSDEPWIPWEIVQPFDYDDKGFIDPEEFWCEQFAISRWISGSQPPRDLPVGKTIVVSPQNTDLENARLEVEFLRQLNTLCSGISCLEPIYRASEVKQYILKEEFAFLHFACHGAFDSTLPNNSDIRLTDSSLSPVDVRRRFKDPRPIVFINACNSSRVGFSFTKMGGWAQKFVEAQVGVFIGAMWEVSDELALEFAKTFYTALLRDNLTVGEAFQKSREAVRNAAPNNSTWLAYSLYGTPDGRIVNIMNIT